MNVKVDFEKLCNLKIRYEDFLKFCKEQQQLSEEDYKKRQTQTVAGMQSAIEKLFED
jgi:hypothetical protein